MKEEIKGIPVVCFTDMDVTIDGIEMAAEKLDEFGIKVKEGHFSNGSFSINGEFEVENPEELDKFILEAMYGKRIDALVAKLNGEWRDKFYKNVNVRPVWKNVQPITDEFEKAYEQTLP